MNKSHLLMAGAAVFILLLLGSCISGWSSPADITAEQIRLIHTQLQNIQHLIVLTRSSPFWLVLLFLAGLLVPIILGLVVLFQADRTAVHGDELLIRMQERGLTSEIIDTAVLIEKTPPQRECSWIWRLIGQVRARTREWRRRARTPEDNPEQH